MAEARCQRCGRSHVGHSGHSEHIDFCGPEPCPALHAFVEAAPDHPPYTEPCCCHCAHGASVEEDCLHCLEEAGGPPEAPAPEPAVPEWAAKQAAISHRVFVPLPPDEPIEEPADLLGEAPAPTPQPWMERAAERLWTILGAPQDTDEAEQRWRAWVARIIAEEHARDWPALEAQMREAFWSSLDPLGLHTLKRPKTRVSYTEAKAALDAALAVVRGSR